MVLLFIAGIACCVAMSMPQVHIVAYCGDSAGPARRRDAVDDARLRTDQPHQQRLHRRPHRRRGDAVAEFGARVSLCCSTCSLMVYFLYVISALFGLFQGGIVPMYAIIVASICTAGGRHAARRGAAGDARRHGARRLDVRTDFRSDGLLSGRLPQRSRLESGQCVDRGGCCFGPAAAWFRPDIRYIRSLKSNISG